MSNYLEDTMERWTQFTLTIKKETTWGKNWKNTTEDRETDLNKQKGIICLWIRRQDKDNNAPLS